MMVASSTEDRACLKTSERNCDVNNKTYYLTVKALEVLASTIPNNSTIGLR